MDLLADMDLSLLKIMKYPAEVLRRPCQPVEVFDQRLRNLAEAMLQVMYAAGGVGLAAPQAGVSLRLFVANPQGQPGGLERIYVNPRIVGREGQVQEEEGCLSIPGIKCRVKRSAVVTVCALDLEGNQLEQTGEGILARIFQHELDHLDGILILNRMSPLVRLANRRAIKDLEQEYARGG